MNSAAARWSVAGLILALGLVGALVGSRGLPQPVAGAPWPGLGRFGASVDHPAGAGEGGADRIAMLAQALRAAIASQRPIEQVSPAIGVDGVLVEDIGIESPPGSFLALLKRGRRAPARHVLTFSSTGGGPSEMRLHLLRGTSDHLAENHSLGWYRVADLPVAPAGVARALIELCISDGTILGGAGDPIDGRPLSFIPSEPLPEAR